MSGHLGLRKKKKGRGKTGENHDNGREALNNVEEIQEAGRPAPDYDDYRVDRFITPLPCARCVRCWRVENGPDGWGDNYVDE